MSERERSQTHELPSHPLEHQAATPDHQRRPEPRASVHPAHLLQRVAGNRFVQRRLAGRHNGTGQRASTNLAVSQPGDLYEQQAEAVAARVAGGSSPAPPGNGSSPRAGGLQRQGGGAPPVSAAAAATIRYPGPGQSVQPTVRSRIEPKLGADLSGVRIHGDASAARAAASLQAQAFTYGNDIFLGGGESASDVGLMAHEATHVVQQGAAPVQRQPQITPAPARVQRLPDFITDRLASYARHIPGYTLFTVIIGFNPLTGSRVDRNAMTLVEGLMGLVPFGTAIFDKLRELGILQRAFEFIEQQLSAHDLTLERLERTIEEAWDDMDFIRLDPFEYNLGVLRRHFGALLDDVRAFAGSVVDAVIEMIKEAALGLAESLLAENRAWALIKKVLHYDPLRDEPVEATTVEILEDFLMLIGKEQELEQMRERGTLQETADWLDTQIAAFLGLLAQLRALITAAWETIQPQNLPDLTSNLRDLTSQAFGFLRQLWDFALTVALKVLELIKNALLGWLASVADEIPGFHLLTVILGRNPFTQEEVPRTAANLIRGFISLLPDGNAMYEQLAETGVIGEAASRIESAIADLGISWGFVTGIFLGIWNSLSIDDLVDPLGAFQRIIEQFGEPVARLFRFIRVVMEEVVKLILALMNFPSDILASIINNALQAFEDIKRDPIGFVKNLLAAVKLGFSNFFGNMLTHLLSGLVDWLFRGLRDAGIEPPTDLSLGSILNLVMQVLGITMDRIWEKLARRIGQERVDQIRGAIDRLTGIWSFVRDVQERGVAAIWEYIESQISNLWTTVLDMARNWIVERIITQVTAKLLSMLDPTGIMAVVNSFIAFFNAVQSAIEYLREILEIINDYVSTVAAIARGAIEPGAAKLEQGLANAIPVAIGFLANQVGLGNIGEKIAEIIGGVRSVVDRALDWLVDQAIRLGERLLRTLGLGGEGEGDPDKVETGNAEHDAAVRAGLAAIAPAEQPFLRNGKISRRDAETVAASVRRGHPIFSRLEVVDGGDSWNYAWAASDGDQHDTISTKAETTTTSSFQGRRITEPGIAEELAAAGYRRPYQRRNRWVIARRDASSGVPRLSVGNDEIITTGPTEDESDRGEIIVELGAILSSVGPHPHLEWFSREPTGGLLRLGSSLRREALSEFRPRSTGQMRQAIEELIGAEDETEGLIEIPVGGTTELEEAELTRTAPRVSGSGLSATAMSDQLIARFIHSISSGWPAGWEVHHVVPTDWGGSDNVSNYAAIPGAAHQDITNWWNRLRSMILRDADAAAARAEGVTTEYRSLHFE